MSNFDKSRVLSYRIELDNSGLTKATKEVEAQMKALNTHIEKMMGSITQNVNNGISRLGATFEKFNRVQGVILTTANVTSAAVKQMGADSNTAATQLGKLNAQVTSLNKRSGSLAANIDKNTQGIRGYNVAVGGLAQANGAVGQSYSKLGDHLRMTNGMFDESTRIVRSAKNDLLDLARINAMVVASFATMIGVPTKFFGDFEKELISLKALGEFSTEQLQTFSDTAKEVSVDIGQMSKDIASAGIEMVRLGLTAEETNIAMRSTADAALANSISIIRAAEIGVGTTRAMGKEITDLEGVLDVMTKTSLKSAADMESLAETFKYAAPIADSAGNSFTELSAATAILSQRMIRSSQAGTTLRGMYTRLQRPVGKSKELLDAMSITLKDQNGKMLPLLDITQQLGMAMEGMSKSTKNAAIEIIFGKYALSGATALINATADEVNYYRTELENATGANKAMADEMKHGVNYEFSKMQASLANAAIAMGESFAPAVINLLQGVTALSEGFQKLTDGQLDSIANFTLWTGGITATAIAIGSTVLAVKTLVGALKALQITTAITAMFGALSAAILEFKIGMTLGLGVTTSATTAFGAMAATVGPLIIILGTLALTVKNVYDEIAALWKEEQNYNEILEMQIGIQKRRIEEMKSAQKEIDALKKKEQEYNQEQPSWASAPADPELLKRSKAFKTRSEGGGKDAETAKVLHKQMMDAAAFEGKRKALGESINKLSSTIASTEVQIAANEKKLAEAKDKNTDAHKQQTADLAESRKVFEEQKKTLKKNIETYDGMNKAAMTMGYMTKEQIENLKVERGARQNPLEQAVQNIVEPAEEVGGGGGSKPKVSERIKNGINDLKQILDEGLAGSKEAAIQLEKVYGANGGKGAADIAIEKEKQFAAALNSSTESFVAQGNACAYYTEMVYKASGASQSLTNAMTPSVNQTIDNLKKLGRGQFFTDPSQRKPGDLAFVQWSNHAGQKWSDRDVYSHQLMVGKNGFHDASGAHNPSGKRSMVGRRGVNALGNLPQLYYRPDPQDLKGAIPSRDELEKTVKVKDWQSYITGLKTLRGGVSATSEDYKELTDEIKRAETEILKLDSAYKDKEADRIDAIRKKADDYVKNILENEIPKLMDEAEKNMATEVGSSFQNDLIQIEKDFERAKEMIAAEFGELGDVSELTATAATKRLAQLSLLSSKTFADLQKQYKQMEKERNAMGMTAVQSEMESLKLEMAELESQYNVLKQISEVDPTNIGAAMGMQMITGIRKFNEERMTDLAQRQLINETLHSLEQERVNTERTMIDMQNQINTGMMGESKLRDAKIQETHKEIANLKHIEELQKEILGGNVDEKRKRHLEHQRTLNEAYKTLTELQNDTFEGQMRISQAKFDKGLINTRQHLNEQIDIYNNRLNDPSVMENQQLYNTILTARNALLMREASHTNDIGEMVKSSLQFLLNSKDLTKDIDWGGYQTNMTEIIDKTVQWGDSISNAIAQFSGAGELVSQSLNFASGIFEGMFQAGFGAFSGNPVAMIDGVVGIIGTLGEAWETLNPSQEKAAEAQRELNKTIIDLDLRAASASIKLRELRGEITAYQAQLEQGKAERDATSKTIEEDAKRLAELKDKRTRVSSATGDEKIPILGWVVGMMRTAELKALSDEILTLEKKLSADKKELAGSELQTAKEQTEQRINNDIYYQKMKLETEAETARLAGNLSEEAEIRRNIKILELKQEAIDAEKELSGRASGTEYAARLFEMIQGFKDKMANAENASDKEILDAKREQGEKILQFEYDRREHEVYMMREGIAKKIALINLERDQETERLKGIEESNKGTEEGNKAKQAWMDNEEKRLKDLTEAWADYFHQISEGLAESQANLGGPLDQIEYTHNKAVRDAQKEFSANAPTPRGLFDVQAFTAIAMAQKTRDNKIKAADRQRDIDKIQFYSNEAQRIGEVKLLEAQNTKDQSKVLRQELQNRMDDLEWWRATEIENANGDKKLLLQIEREYWAKRIGFVQEYQDKAGEYAIQQFNDLKELRDLQFQEDSRFYENELLKFERQIADYQKARDDIQNQIDYYEGLIAEKQRDFEDMDKSLYQAAFSNVNLPDEIREGLEAIANPTDVPNSRFSRDTQRKAIEEHIALLRTENEALKDYEDISMSSYWTEASRIATVGGKFYQSLLEDEALMEKMTRAEQVDIRKKLSEEYMAFQEAERALQEAIYEEELKRLDDEATANDKAQKKVQRDISDKRYELDLLTRQYEDDGRKIEDEIRAIEMAHGDWAFSLQQVKDNFEGLITSIKSNYGILKEGLGSIVPTATGWAVQSTDPSAGGTGSGFLGAGGTTSGGGRSRTQTGSYLLNGGDGWYYSSTSDMMAYQSKGYADGFMVKNMDKYKGDNAHMGGGMRFDANEALIPLDKFWRELERTGGDAYYNYDMRNSTFRSEDDIVNAIERTKKRDRMRWGMNHGTRLSGQGAR